MCSVSHPVFPPAHTGSTDPLIVIKVLEFHGIPKEQAMARMAEVQKVRIGCKFGRQRSDAP